MRSEFLGGRVVLHGGDSRDVLKGLESESISAVVTDPPYALVSIGKRFGAEDAAPAMEGATGAYARASRGFMGKSWDTGEAAFAVTFWAEIMRVLKPGGHVVAFSGTRTYHRLACAIEDAGFEIRDQLAWCYGAGFPKSHNVSRKLDGIRCSGEGCEAAQSILQHDMRPVRDSDVSQACDAEKERGQVLLSRVSEQGSHRTVQGGEPEESVAQGTERGVEGRGNSATPQGQLPERPLHSLPAGPDVDGAGGRLRDGASSCDGTPTAPSVATGGMCASSGSQTAQQCGEELGTVAGQSQPQDGRAWPNCDRCGKPIIPDGIGTALKPAWEPIVLARKPLAGTVAANVLAHGTGALNIDACRVDAEKPTGWGGGAAGGNTWTGDNCGLAKGGEARPVAGRWPANIVHDGSDEVVAAFPESKSGALTAAQQVNGGFAGTVNCYGTADKGGTNEYAANSGSAARFFASFPQDNTECTPSNANDAESTISPSNEHVASALSRAAALSMPESALTNIAFPEPSMSVTLSELRLISATVTELTQSLERRFLLGLPPENITTTISHVQAVATKKLTDTTTITISLLKSNGFAELVTFNITRQNLELGAKDSVNAQHRLFYSSKADKTDRMGSGHPTVKPVDLMQWLCRLVTPPGGVVLDPFAGSGSTGEAAWREGFSAVLIEREEEYQADIAARLSLADAGPMQRKARAVKQVGSAGPLFGADNDNAGVGADASTGRLRTNLRTIGPIGLKH